MSEGIQYQVQLITVVPEGIQYQVQGQLHNYKHCLGVHLKTMSSCAIGLLGFSGNSGPHPCYRLRPRSRHCPLLTAQQRFHVMRVELKMAATPFPPLEPGSFPTPNPESHDVEHQGLSAMTRKSKRRQDEAY